VALSRLAENSSRVEPVVLFGFHRGGDFGYESASRPTTCGASVTLPVTRNATARPRDLAKIGQLVLERGKWHGRQIVSSSWIEDSTTPRLSGKDAAMMFYRPEGITSYGYLWWLGRSPPEHPERDMIAGGGYGGQRVYILPSLGAVVVTTAGLYGDKASGLTALTTLNECVFPAAVPH
jgi:CubicO group peptidase (beta-lactamase class C family)